MNEERKIFYRDVGNDSFTINDFLFFFISISITLIIIGFGIYGGVKLSNLENKCMEENGVFVKTFNHGYVCTKVK